MHLDGVSEIKRVVDGRLTLESTSRIYPNVHLGEGAEIGDYVVIGVPPAGAQPGEFETHIGAFAVIRSHAVIYAGNTIGTRFVVGHGALIREHNTIGDEVSIGSHALIEHHVSIGNRVRVHGGAFIPEYTILETESWIGPNVTLTNARFPASPTTKQHLEGPTIRRGAKVGAGATVLPGILIGEMALVAAGAVVTKDVPPRMLVAGNPARVLRSIDELVAPWDPLEKPYPLK